MVTRRSGPLRLHHINPVSRGRGLEGLPGGIHIDLGCVHRLVGSETVQVNDDFAGPGNRDEFEVAGGRFHAGGDGGRDRGRWRAVVMPLVGGRHQGTGDLKTKNGHSKLQESVHLVLPGRFPGPL